MRNKNQTTLWQNFVLVTILAVIIFLGGCIGSGEGPAGGSAEKNTAENVKEICIRACGSEISGGGKLDKGPCLLNPVREYPDWVCDVAHEPRQAVDNLPENQCSAFSEGRARHFVEVTTECKPIKSW